MGCTSSALQSDLGVIEFPNTGAPEAQHAFQRGIAALHSFWYDEARAAFQEAQDIDPSFVMAYWGEAMTYNSTLWDRQDTEAARNVLQRLAPTSTGRVARAASDREKGFIYAINALYGDAAKPERDVAFAKAMQTLYHTYPDDVEVAAFYGLAILGKTELGVDFRGAMEAAALLEPFFDTHPQHPGVLHYLIHAYDDPVHATLGLRQALLYADVAPASAHALHMPAHIFVQLGRWEDAAKTDEAAFAARAAMVEKQELPVSRHGFHSLSWMLYEYTQLGRYDKAREKLQFARKAAQESDAASVQRTYASMWAQYVIESRDWPSAAGLFPLAKNLEPTRAKANAFLAVGIAATHTSDVATVRAVETELQELENQINATQAPRLADEVKVIAAEVKALRLMTTNQTTAALNLLEDMLPIEVEMGLPIGPPSHPMKPVVELYAELLLEAGKPHAAIEQFEDSLQRTRNRAASLLGLARAAARSGQTERAQRTYQQFMTMWHQADTNVEAFVEAQNWTRGHESMRTPDAR